MVLSVFYALEDLCPPASHPAIQPPSPAVSAGCPASGDWQPPAASGRETGFGLPVPAPGAVELRMAPQLSPHNCHPTTITPQLSPNNCHPTTVTQQLSPNNGHPTTVTQQLSPNNCHITGVRQNRFRRFEPQLQSKCRSNCSSRGVLLRSVACASV